MRLLIWVVFVLLHTVSWAQTEPKLLVEAEKQLQAGDTTAAIETFIQVLETNPQSFVAVLRLSETYFENKDLKNAILYCNLALDIASNYIDETKLQLAKHPFDSIAKSRVRQMEKDKSAAHHLKGKIRKAQERHTEAVAEFNDALKLQPENVDVLIDRGIIAFELADMETGLYYFKKATNIAPKNPIAWFNLGKVHYRMANTDSAIFYYKKSIASRPAGFSQSYMELGDILMTKERFEEAAQHYSGYIALDSGSEKAYYQRASCFMVLEEYDLALDDWTEAANLNPKNPEIARNLGLTYLQLLEPENAINWFSVSIDLAPDKNYAFANRGYAYYLNKDYKAAIADFDITTQQLPKYPNGFYLRALTYMTMGKRKKACQDLNKAISLGFKERNVDSPLSLNCYKK